MWKIILFTLSILLPFSQATICISNNCIFNNNLYPPGFVLNFVCFQLKCNSIGKWDVIGVISSNCAVCHVSNDPHFKTFDNYFTSIVWALHNYYDWHGTCNYSISQPTCSSVMDTYNPPYGIFGDFVLCPNPTVSCLDKTTYKINLNTILVIQHKPVVSITINGVAVTIPSSPGVPYDCGSPNYFPVVLWKNGLNGVNIVGLDYSIQAFPEYMFIFTDDSHLYKISGLCGFYSGTGNIADDFQTRDCITEANVPPFAESWKTLDQNDDCKEYPIEDIKCGDEELYRQNCTDTVQNNVNSCGRPNDPNNIDNAIENCVKDCCVDPENCGKWTEVAGSFICDIGKYSKMHKQNPDGKE